MPDINILSPHVADMIAAGEVVERPASVIKELVENSFDAGARNISVEIRGGGATYIRVTDDGRGMAPEDAGVAFLRHATSKLKDERGLEAISTMGFRGEALAAISAVSHIELRTRRPGDREGTLVTLSAGDIQDMGSVGCPDGSTMVVRELFFNTPARLKFLKSDRSEAGACLQAALRCALGRPQVSVRFIRDGKEEFFSPGDGREDSCVYSLLGREQASGLLACQSSGEGMKLSGFVSSPAAGRGNRSGQFFFCNGRYIRSPLLQSAVEQAYKNSLLSGRYPACVLYLEISPGAVDVNVHPAKTEVKFSNEKKVFDLVYQAVRLSLEGEDRTARVELSPSTKKLIQPRGDFYQTMKAEDLRAAGYEIRPQPARAPAPAGRAPSAHMKSASVPYMSGPGAPDTGAYAVSPVKKADNSGFSPIPPVKNVENPVQNVESPLIPDHKIVGEAMRTYIIVERGEELILIDKHAAHERLIFDRLKARGSQILSQSLLSPETLRLGPGEAELLEENRELLRQLGFETEPFGEREFIIRAVPADMAPGEAAAALEEICEKLSRGQRPDPASARDEILHTVACKAAIKAGWETQGRELERLVEAVLSGRVKYCPHGRPVSVTLTKKELDRQFRRIV